VLLTCCKSLNGKSKKIWLSLISLTPCSGDADNQLRTAAYEVLNAFVTNAANDSLAMVASLSDVILERLEKTLPLQAQVVSIEDKMTLEEMQTSLSSVVVVSVSKYVTPKQRLTFAGYHSTP
jgi:importin subunit beta-1